MFKSVCFIGIGHIGSSLALGLRANRLATRIIAIDANADHRAKAVELGTVDQAFDDYAAVSQADLVVISVPVGAMAAVGEAIGPHLQPGTIVTDVGSVKMAVVRDLGPSIPQGVHFIPGHPIAGTEHSGPTSGVATLFQGRWQILTPLPGTDQAALDKLSNLWRAVGAQVEHMEPQHHDRVLAITSHLPHLIAYTIVGTATDLETTLQQEVIKFSASGFRDFTRIAASDPVMWRDIFLNNREAVLEVIQRFTEDLTHLQRAIRWGEGEVLENRFAATRAVRRAIIDAKQS